MIITIPELIADLKNRTSYSGVYRPSVTMSTLDFEEMLAIIQQLSKARRNHVSGYDIATQELVFK